MKKSLSVLAVSLFTVALASFSIYQGNTSVEPDTTEKNTEVVTEEEVSWKYSHPKVRGIYVTGPTAGIEKMDDIIQLINDTELNAIVLDVKDDNGNISFYMDNPNVQATDACIPYISDINTLLAKLKENDIYVIARIPCFKDPILAKARPDLALRADTGEYVTDAGGNAWVNPCKEEVWDYIISIACSCCELGFDEIQLDYVRFPVGENAERAMYGAPTDDDSRCMYINNFIEKISNSVHAYDVPLTADVFGTIIKSTEDSKHIGQDYVLMASSLDALCPMIYPSHYANGEFGIEFPDLQPYETIYAALLGSKEKLNIIPEDDCAIIRPWLQAFTASWLDNYIEYDGTAIRSQIQAVYDAGYDEWILWNSKSNYTSQGLN